MALIAIVAGFFTYDANAWKQIGNPDWTGPHTWFCRSGANVCMESADPTDPSENVGDRVKYKNAQGQTVYGTIIRLELKNGQAPPQIPNGCDLMESATHYYLVN